MDIIRRFVEWVSNNPFADETEARAEWARLHCKRDKEPLNTKNLALYDLLFENDGIFIYKWVRARDAYNYDIKKIV